MTHRPLDGSTPAAPVQGADSSRRRFLRATGVAGLGAAALAAGAGEAFAAPGEDQPEASEERAAAAAPAGTRAPVRTGTGLDRLPHPLVIGHRGAPGYRPEETLGSYELALELGADVIEPDLVPTKDGHLVIRHENNIAETTDVADHPEFAGRKTTKTIDGAPLTGWFTEDFTLAELKTLRAKERLPQQRQRNTLYDGRWQILTFRELADFARKRGRELGRDVWLYPETKHPSYFRSIGLPLEERLADELRRTGLAGRRGRAILQSFEPSSLQRLAKLVDNPRIQLLSGPTSQPYDFVLSGDKRTVADLVTPEGLRWIASFAHGIGPTTQLIAPVDASGKLLPPTTLVRDAHAANLLLHPYTVRNENGFLPLDYRRGTDPNAYGDAIGWARYLYELGVDGFFTDQTDTTILARQDFWAAKGVN
ncbi:glycerophosphodiester phosphodiesterase [Streptomyces sp. CB01881]|uniref:glycerophosphodiester phosphodiesterase n=1 Tax=Streptomyces sp. CB01881 TaxID=2078691 RepID=UPI000CDC846D|nr:glycerophosphodiester phosphodiesterase [Streptomyces sp. CB01881]AUY53342.1 glycerophosphodiester phosphodiesterase [Streptomyces sp. CB01881]TYC69496.1 glycerophosphodiester phosphodiesterase [Streptomyces sp. CB01881]